MSSNTRLFLNSQDVKKQAKLADDDTEFVVVSDTVRQRRSRTPSATTPTSAPIASSSIPQSTEQNVMPDLLPKTFHLAESSALFSEISTGRSNDDSQSDNQAPPRIVEVRESNLESLATPITMSPNVGQIVDTVSILEYVVDFEPEYVETVHIVDITSETSDTDTSSTPASDEPKLRFEMSSGEEASSRPDSLKIEKERISFKEKRARYAQDRDLLRDSERKAAPTTPKSPKSPMHRKKLTPTLREILSATERDSFYNSDKENFDEPLVFSDDEDIPRFSMEMSNAFDSDSDTVFSQTFFCSFIFPISFTHTRTLCLFSLPPSLSVSPFSRPLISVLLLLVLCCRLWSLACGVFVFVQPSRPRPSHGMAQN